MNAKILRPCEKINLPLRGNSSHPASLRMFRNISIFLHIRALPAGRLTSTNGELLFAHAFGSKSGFTLAEILIVMMIIMALVGVVGFNVMHHIKTTKVNKARIQIHAYSDLIKQYMIAEGRIPTMEQGLEALVRKPTIPPVPRNYPEGGYMEKLKLPLDPWGNPYIYRVPGREGLAFEVLSYGSDGEPGGTGYNADISSAE